MCAGPLQEGRTPLFFAARYNRYRMVKRLLRRHVHPDIPRSVCALQLHLSAGVTTARHRLFRCFQLYHRTEVPRSCGRLDKGTLKS